MPELSSEDSENNREYSLIFFTFSYLERRGRDAASYCSNWKTEREKLRGRRSWHESICRSTVQITRHWNYHWPWHRF